ncbi:DNA polymerase III subunit gamma/tau [Gorillibacterium timonense]|uniref:DNA polymerase III subunit gamma/tau n=1 Tax=Gorillibacterium timonense TaxID=1689269 RepID=UPI00071C705B|nr:DNA polymerase III subunit gamma/tau [Gorillibacterium timonense]
MAHIALYRSWRPQTFADVVGQAHVVRTLQNALKENRLSHAYLFNGPRGTGKTTLARLLAKAVNCERGPAVEPCNECDACRRIAEGSVIDVLEIDAASNRGVDEIRDLRDKTKYSPTEVRRKVYIIDEVHMLTTEAFNALLKTLEEPPEHVMFILATTEPHKLPATIISRCQRFDFRRVSTEEQTDWLERICRTEGFVADRDALQYIAKLSEGGMRDAVSLLDQISSYSDERITYQTVVTITGGISSEQFGHLARAVLERNIGRCLKLVEEMAQEGKSADKCMESLMVYFRDLLMIRMVPKSEAVTDRILHVEEFRKVSEGFPSDELFRVIETLNHYQTEMKYSAQPQTLFEVALMKLCTAPQAPAPQGAAELSSAGRDEIRELSRKVALLEQQISKLRETGAAAISSEASTGHTPAASIVSSPVRTSSSSSGASSGVRKRIKLEPFLQSRDSELLKQALLKWSQVLAMVKERKITVHAWLIDGEPVGYDEDTVLLAFKSSMHRETTEKPANKQLIEQAMSEILGHPVRLATVMMKEWKEADAEAKEAPPEILQLEPEDPSQEAEWVSEAIRMFGPDLVKIKEE